MCEQDATRPDDSRKMAGRGRGPCGCGMRRQHHGRHSKATGTPLTIGKEEQKKILQEQLKSLEDEKARIESKLKEIEE